MHVRVSQAVPVTGEDDGIVFIEGADLRIALYHESTRSQDGQYYNWISWTQDLTPTELDQLRGVLGKFAAELTLADTHATLTFQDAATARDHLDKVTAVLTSICRNIHPSVHTSSQSGGSSWETPTTDRPEQLPLAA